MKALLLFHLRVGIRVAVRSFVPLFSALLVVIMLQMYPVAFVVFLARSAFALHPSISDVSLAAAIAVILPRWAAPRLAHGLNGWLRHLSLSSTANRRGLTLALLVTELPLAVSLLLLGIVAAGKGIPIGAAALRWVLVMAASALAATPAKRIWISAPAAYAAAGLTLLGAWPHMALAAVILVAADFAAGPLKEHRRSTNWSPAESLFDTKIAWRALGWIIPSAFAAALLILGAGGLFVVNNELTGGLASGAWRFAGGMACLMFIGTLSSRLATRRPVWPLARSFPRSSARRISADALFLGLHAIPLAALLAPVNPAAALSVLLLLPVLCLRAAGHMRRLHSQKTGTGAFYAEGFLLSALAALVSWAAWLAPAAALPAFYAARKLEREQKVTSWQENHYLSAGDSLSWSDQ